MSHAYIRANDSGRVCDVCARYRPRSGFRKLGNTWICDLHPSFIPREVLEKRQYVTPTAPKAIKDAKPFDPRDTYEASETEILALVLTKAPQDVFPVESARPDTATAAETVQAAAWGALYLYELIAEARRPRRWVTLATARLAVLADWLRDHQASAVTSAVGYGGYNRSTTGEEYYSEDSAVAGLALLRAYQTIGTASYLTAARACAWFLRGAQCGDKIAAHASSTDAAGATPFHFGMWTHEIALNGGTLAYNFDHRYHPGDLVGLEFLNAFHTAVGDETIGSPTITSTFTASRAALVSVAIAEARAFWETAQPDVDAAASVKGFSTTTPREFFDAYPLSKGAFIGRGSWQYQDGPLATGSLITAFSWALGIRAFRALDGDSAFVTGLFDWLMSFTDSGSHALPARDSERHIITGYDDRLLYSGTLGTYDPTFAPTTLLEPGGRYEGSPLYDLAALGILAPLYSARQAAAFKAAKIELATPRRKRKEGSSRDGEYLYLAPLGRCGLSYQPYSDAAGGRDVSVSRAAQAGLLYREPPEAHMHRGIA